MSEGALDNFAEFKGGSTDFFHKIVQKEVTVMIFYANWHEKSKEIKMNCMSYATEFPMLDFLSVNVDRNPTLADNLNVQELPHVSLLTHGDKENTFRQIKALVGSKADDLYQTIQSLVKHKKKESSSDISDH